MRPPGLTRAAILGVVVILAAGSPATAQPAPAGAPDVPSPPPGAAEPIREEVRRLHNEALSAFKRNDLLVAYEGFSKAWAQQKVPRIAGNLGRTELRLEKYRDAAEHLALFLREDANLDEGERNEVTRLLREAKARVGALRLEVTPPGAAVLVDGAGAGTAPIPHELYLEPGPHSLEARSGAAVARQAITARAGVLEPVLQLHVAPPPSEGAPEGPPPEARPFPVWAVVLIGGAALAAGGGALIGVGFSQRSDALALVPKDAQGQPLCATAGSGQPDLAMSTACDQVRSRAASADLLGNTGVALAAVGGGVAAGALIAYLLWPPRAGAGKAATSTLVPLAGPSGAALLWQGSF